MFVHIGGETVIDVRQVVAILDARPFQRTEEARALVDRAREGQAAAPGTWASARAIVVTTTGVFPTPISPATVARRIQNPGRFPLGSTAER